MSWLRAVAFSFLSFHCLASAHVGFFGPRLFLNSISRTLSAFVTIVGPGTMAGMPSEGKAYARVCHCTPVTGEHSMAVVSSTEKLELLITGGSLKSW